MIRVLIVLLALLLAAPGAVPAPQPTARTQVCHYSAEVIGTYTQRSTGYSFTAPIGRISVESCTSPGDLQQQVEQLTQQVYMTATATALSH